MRSHRHPTLGTAGLAPFIAWRGPATVVGALLLVVLTTAQAHAQSNAFLACTPGVLANCAEVRLTATPGGGTGGTTLFGIALRNAGSTTQPALATSVYNLVFGTGLPAAAPGAEVAGPLVPVPVGGAGLADASPWDLLESGNAVFLSALSNQGIGGCVAGAPVGGFGQAGTTCGTGQFLTFSFSTPRLLDPRAFTVLNLEVVGLAAGLPADSCGQQPACVITPLTPLDGTVIPEPSMGLLLATGLVLLGGMGARQRRPSASATIARETPTS